MGGGCLEDQYYMLFCEMLHTVLLRKHIKIWKFLALQNITGKCCLLRRGI